MFIPWRRRSSTCSTHSRSRSDTRTLTHDTAFKKNKNSLPTSDGTHAGHGTQPVLLGAGVLCVVCALCVDLSSLHRVAVQSRHYKHSPILQTGEEAQSRASYSRTHAAIITWTLLTLILVLCCCVVCACQSLLLLPPAHYNSFVYIISFLRECLSMRHVNKIELSQLLIIFSSCLMHQQIQFDQVSNATGATNTTPHSSAAPPSSSSTAVSAQSKPTSWLLLNHFLASEEFNSNQALALA